MSHPSVSFCVVTGGKRPEKLERLVRSIQKCGIPRYEIIIAGNPHPIPDTIPVHMPDEAQGGKMGILRNSAARVSRNDILVSLDDDIILHPDWWTGLTSQEEIPPIMTPKILLPDGTRFWDYAACRDSPGGQRILNYNETDPHFLLTGGGGWVMTRSTWERVQWNDRDEFYKGGGEDTGFSLSARAAGFTPQHNRKCIVFHDDQKYTGFGRTVLTRKFGGTDRESLRLQIARAHPIKTLLISKTLIDEGCIGDAVDALRLGLLLHPNNPNLITALNSLLKSPSNTVEDSEWFWDGHPQYWEIRAWADKKE